MVCTNDKWMRKVVKREETRMHPFRAVLVRSTRTPPLLQIGSLTVWTPSLSGLTFARMVCVCGQPTQISIARHGSHSVTFATMVRGPMTNL